jgi:hypothetical protein
MISTFFGDNFLQAKFYKNLNWRGVGVGVGVGVGSFDLLVILTSVDVLGVDILSVDLSEGRYIVGRYIGGRYIGGRFIVGQYIGGRSIEVVPKKCTQIGIFCLKIYNLATLAIEATRIGLQFLELRLKIDSQCFESPTCQD